MEKRWTDLSTGKTYTYSWGPNVDEEKLNKKALELLKAEYRLMLKNHRYIKYEKVEPARYVPGIRNVIFNPPATIVFWADDTKTVVKCQDGDEFDAEKGLAMAITKKALAGNRARYCNEIDKWVKKYEANTPEETPLDRLISRMREDINEAKDIIGKVIQKTETEDGVDVKIELTGKK